MSKRALVRAPGPRLDEGIVTHLERQPVDLGHAVRQWEAYGAALEATGWDLVQVPPAAGCPDAVFVEDAAVVFRNLAVICRPGADSRKAETHDVEKTFEGLGWSVNRIVGPGTLDGGDVLKVGDTIYVGRGGRTNAEGIAQLRDILGPIGGTVVAVPNTKVLHLKSAVTALPDGTVIGYEPVVEDPRMFPRFLAMPEESGAHVVDLGGGQLLMAASCPRSIELVADLGYDPIVVDISEFEKLEGCVTCLSIRLRGAP